MENIKVLTLNCWGVFFPIPTDRKDERMRAIRDRLVSDNFDIIFLQEVWISSDFQMIEEALNKRYYSNYFHGKFIGTGMCIFSKWPIESAIFHSFAANGYPHWLLRGDWFCGKGVGLVRITTESGCKVNLYVTHLIARYDLDYDKDKFCGHRVSQIVEMMEFVRMTSPAADVTIIAGDFNYSSENTSMEMFRLSLNLSDAWIHNSEVKGLPNLIDLEKEGSTCDRADNPYSNKTWTNAYGNGERLDYILYRAASPTLESSNSQSCFTIECDRCYLEMRAVPDGSKDLHYSDHEGVAAVFTITKSNKPVTVTPSVPMAKLERLQELCIDLTGKLTVGLQNCQSGRTLNLLSLFVVYLSLCIVILSCPSKQHWFESFVRLKLTAFLGAVFFALFWGCIVGRTAERCALKNAVQSSKLLHDYYRDYMSITRENVSN